MFLEVPSDSDQAITGLPSLPTFMVTFSAAVFPAAALMAPPSGSHAGTVNVQADEEARELPARSIKGAVPVPSVMVAVAGNVSGALGVMISVLPSVDRESVLAMFEEPCASTTEASVTEEALRA